MQDGDGLVMANFRADRAREILATLLDPVFDVFKREKRPAFACALGMVEYSTELNAFLTALFPPEDLTGTLGEVVAAAGKRQLRIAETEKYAHVTFFRSEEHTSELQSLMRISSAVFCLKQKKQNHTY